MALGMLRGRGEPAEREYKGCSTSGGAVSTQGSGEGKDARKEAGLLGKPLQECPGGWGGELPGALAVAGVLSAAAFQRRSHPTCKPAGSGAHSAPAAAQHGLPRGAAEAHGATFVAGAPWQQA